MNDTPQIQGYQFDQRLLLHPLAEIWHGRSFTGMEVVALLLTAAGAADPQVRERLAQSSRGAALSPEQQETPLWAANFSSDRPYAITQLVPGQSGAERLLDPLDGLMGNDEQSLNAVRAQLSQYGATSPEPAQVVPHHASTTQAAARPAVPEAAASPAVPEVAASPAVPDAASPVEIAREYRQKLGPWVYAVVVVIVLIVFTVTYSIGAAVGSAVKDEPTTQPDAAAVSPAALPDTVLLPGVSKVATAAYIRPGPGSSIIGATYPSGADVQVVSQLDLPFAFGWPRPPVTRNLGESSTTLYRLVQTETQDPSIPSKLIARIAVRSCPNLAGCLKVRPAFDQDWTKAFKAPAPRTAKDAQTWFSESNVDPYAVVMTRAYNHAGRWWLVGVAVTSVVDEKPTAQQILNDIRRQTN